MEVTEPGLDSISLHDPFSLYCPGLGHGVWPQAEPDTHIYL